MRLGMSPMQALVAATGAAAAALNQSDLGVLEPGRRASFLVLSADPLTDIRNTRRIEAVYLNGREIDREGIAGSLASPAPWNTLARVYWCNIRAYSPPCAS